MVVLGLVQLVVGGARGARRRCSSAFAFAGAGIAGTTFMRSWIDFDYVNLALIPMFLFSATFFPLSQYPDAVQRVVRCTPLYQGVVLERALVLGQVELDPAPATPPTSSSSAWLGLTHRHPPPPSLLQP